MAFWILSPFMVLAALGMLVVRKAVHAALLLAVVMLGLAILATVVGLATYFIVTAAWRLTVMWKWRRRRLRG